MSRAGASCPAPDNTESMPAARLGNVTPRAAARGRFAHHAPLPRLLLARIAVANALRAARDAGSTVAAAGLRLAARALRLLARLAIAAIAAAVAARDAIARFRRSRVTCGTTRARGLLAA